MPELMKGKVFAERKHTVKYPCIAEVKYDEIRVHVKYVGVDVGPEGVLGGVEFLSYDGKPLYNLGLYSQQFLSFFRESGLTELDMGLEVNGNFNDSYRWARSSSGIPKEKFDKKTGKTAPALNHSMVQFFLFDIPECPKPYRGDGWDRMADREECAALLRSKGLKINIPVHEPVFSEEELNRYFEQAREAGFEGLMVKQYDHTYQKGKRTDGWLKMKPEAEADGLIVGFAEAVSEAGVQLGRVGAIMVRMEDGSLAAPHGIAHELATYMWQHPEEYLNTQWLTFKYMERDRQGGYRHPTFGRLREAKG